MSEYGMSLFPQHAALIRASGIAGDVARARGYVSVDTKVRLEKLGFAESQSRTPGLFVPLWSPTDAEYPAGYQYRPDQPREVDGRAVKYESLPGSRPILDVSPVARRWVRTADSPLWVTEGCRKGDALATVGACAISLLGVAGWLEAGMALSDWRDVRVRGRLVLLAFDSDVTTKPAVRGQLDALAAYLAGKGATVKRVIIPAADGAKVGVDDFLGSGHTVQELEALAVDDDTPPPSPLTRASVLPEFPVDAFPDWLADHVDALAHATQTPRGMAGTAALGTLGACAGGRVVVEVRRGWREPTNLYAVTALPPGNRKSAVHDATTAPLRDAEVALIDQARPAVSEAETTKRIAEKAAERSRTAAGNAESNQRDKLTAEYPVLLRGHGHRRDAVQQPIGGRVQGLPPPFRRYFGARRVVGATVPDQLPGLRVPHYDLGRGG